MAMKLKELLSELPQQKLVNIIQDWGGKIQKSVSKNELIYQLSELMQNPVNLEKAVYSLSKPAQNLLGVVLMCNGKIDFAKLSPLLKGNELSYSYSSHLSHLESRALFIVKYGGKYGTITIPEELISPLKKVLAGNTPVDQVKIKEEKSVVMEASPIIDDIFRICIYSTNKGGIRLTQQGEIYKKDKQEILNILGTDNTKRLGFAIEMMTACYLSNSNERMLHILDENALTIFSRSKEKITIDLIVPIIKMHYLNEELVANFLKILSLNCDEDWMDFRDFISNHKMSFFEKKDIKGWLEFDIYKLTKLINCLYFLGILDLKYSEVHGSAPILSFKVSPFGRRVIEFRNRKKEVEKHPDRHFIVLPTFEINVFAEEPDYHTMYRLGKIAKMLRFDTACTFRLEKEFVLKELTGGTTLSEIIAFLEQHSKKELPQNVHYSLLDWGSKFGKVTAGKDYIEITDPSLCERVEQILSPFIVRSIKNPVIIFNEYKRADVLSTLRKADIFPSEVKKISVEKKTKLSGI